MAEFDGTNWTVYDTSNSGLPDNHVNAIAIDAGGNKWIGTGSWGGGGGLAEFDGVNWTVYNTSNSGLPSNYVDAVAIDAGGNKWIGTYGGGLAEFDGVNWTVYNTSNSGLPSNYVNAIAIDVSGNKWMGTGGEGLAVYTGGAGIKEKNEKCKLQNVKLFTYPNPFTRETVIRYSVLAVSGKRPAVSVKVYDISGRLVKTLVNKTQKSGYYTIKWDGTNNAGRKLSSGIYFIRLNAGKVSQTKKIILMR